MTLPTPAWMRTIWLLAGAGLVLSVLAATVPGAIRRVSVVALFGCMVAVAVMVTRQGTEARHQPIVRAADVLSTSAWSSFVNAMVAILYNLGIAVIIYAVLARLNLVTEVDSEVAVRYLPIVVAVYLLALVAAVVARHNLGHPFAKNAYTKYHGLALWISAGIVTLLGLGLLFNERLHLGPITILEGDIFVMLLFGVLMVGTQSFLVSGIPTLFDYVNRFSRSLAGEGAEGEVQDTPPVVYAASLALLIAALLGLLALQLDVFSRLGQATALNALVLVAIVPVALALFFGFSALLIWKESKRGMIKQKMSAEARNDVLVYSLSALVGIVFATLLAMVLADRITTLFGVTDKLDLAKDLSMLTVVSSTGPIGFYLARKHQRLDEIEKRLPDFLNDLAENRRAGLTMANAIQNTARGDFGALSPEIRKMANQVGWGVPFAKALKEFASRVQSRLVDRSVSLIIEASLTGGAVADVLKAAANDARELKNLEAERRSSMMVYVLVLYVVFFVFMMVVAALATQFLPEIIAAQQAMAESNANVPGLDLSAIDPEELNFSYFNAALVQAIGTGIVGGVLMEAKATAGFRHVAIMAFSAWLLFRVMLGMF